MNSTTVMVANRGEIALRIIRTARELGYRTVAVYAADDIGLPHVAAADTAVALDGVGPLAYLDVDAIVAAARRTSADLVHPGYGFLSEDPRLARACADAGLRFVGPSAAVLEMFGDKASARQAAVNAGVPVLDATTTGVDEAQVAALLAAHPAGIMIKAVAGGGGRGMREVRDPAGIADAMRVCAAEAAAGFGNSELFAEELCGSARHVEVQVVAAGTGSGTTALALGDRDCSVQRRHQKLIEIAPAQQIPDGMRVGLHSAAAVLCAANDYRGLATVEFLVTDNRFVFLEVNPRIQVEHTVTEEVTGCDLVGIGLAIAGGADYDALGLPSGITSSDGETVDGVPAHAAGIAIQARVNMETTAADGTTVAQSGTLRSFSAPTGPGVRVDTFGRPGLTTSPRYDSLLAKVIGHTARGEVSVAIRKVSDALAEFVIDGVATNIGLLRAILNDKEFDAGPVTTGYLGEHIGELIERAAEFDAASASSDAATDDAVTAPVVDVALADGEELLVAPMSGVVVEVAQPNTSAAPGIALAVLEAMKMQHTVSVPTSSMLVRALVGPGDAVVTGQPLAVIAVIAVDADVEETETVDPDHIRPDLAEIHARHQITRDAARPAAVDKRHRIGRRTARENIADLVDDGSFVEYGALALAAQRTRRTEEDLVANTPADGLVGGVATIGADRVGASAAQAVVISYDYTVLAGTQGMRNHAKTDRLIELAKTKHIPLVIFAEGGGGRPGDTDANGAAGLELNTFREMAALRGRVPTIAVVSGRCFAGNAALAGACDLLIATPDANIGMGGPAMVEGGGLGVFAPEDIGPVELQRRNGVVHIAARNEADAVDLARRYLGYFQGDSTDWTAPDTRLSRHVVPENRLRAYDVRDAIASIADIDSTLELRADYGLGVVTALIRVEGVAYGVLANSTAHLGGAIDAEAADKAVDFLELCEAHRLPVVTLCDTPGFMVGPDSEADATVRRFSRMFVAGARLTVPFGTIILRKGYGLGAMAMAGGSFHAPEFTVAWPTGEIGPMGLEGSVRLGFRKELEAVVDPAAREKLFDELLAKAYEHGKALHSATTFELDDVIDPADSRVWIRQLGRDRAALS